MPCKISIVGKYFFSLSLFNYFLHILLPFSFSLRTIFFIIVMTNLPMCRGENKKWLHKLKYRRYSIKYRRYFIKYHRYSNKYRRYFNLSQSQKSFSGAERIFLISIAKEFCARIRQYLHTFFRDCNFFFDFFCRIKIVAYICSA